MTPGILLIAALSIGGCTSSETATSAVRPFTHTPFPSGAVVLSCLDHNRDPGEIACAAPGLDGIDQDTGWSWWITPGSTVVSPASGRVVDVAYDEPWWCVDGSGVRKEGTETAIRIQLDPPHERWQFGVSNLVPGVTSSLAVHAGDPIGQTKDAVHCSGNVALVVWDTSTGDVVDPAGWSQPTPDPLAQAKGFQAADLFEPDIRAALFR